MKFATPNRNPFGQEDVFKPYIASAKAALHARAAKVAILAAAGIVLLIVIWPLALLWGAFFAWRGMQRAKKRGRALVQTTARRAKS